MLFIISENLDISTNDVIDWLECTPKILRVNNLSLKINLIDYKKKEILFTYKDEIINSKKISSFWFRRGNILNQNIENLIIDVENLNNKVYYHLSAEWEELVRFFSNKFLIDEKVVSLGSYNSKDKKLGQLFEAQKCGLRIPKTLITTSKQELIEFKKSCQNKIITKGISSSPSFTFNNISLEGYTEEVSLEFIEQLSLEFFPSLFQENIDKQLEIRTFFLKDTFYSMAIFSQNDEQTKTDVRKYNDEKPNRTVPYKLPKEIEIKLQSFMLCMNLDTGSIDLIVDNDDNYYFLEVNPNGQFGMVSTPCNYYIERDIAKLLTYE
jgi:ATP-GRASP peptide maturase of grasp-with-spasm system